MNQQPPLSRVLEELGGMSEQDTDLLFSRNRAQQFSNYVPPQPPKKKPRTIEIEVEHEKICNDCEILVYGKEQQEYAEGVERALRDMGFKVDIMFLRAEAKLGVLLENLSSMGTMFAVVIHQQHQAHQSLNVHVVETPPTSSVQRKHECHKNMPLQKAYGLLQSRSAQYKMEEFKVVPEATRKIMQTLLERRLMPDSGYQSLVNYLQKRWKDQRSLQKKVTFEDGTGISTPEELQKRVLFILGIPDPNPTPDEVAEQATTLPAGIINDNPQVQQAVDTLMRSSLNPFQL